MALALACAIAAVAGGGATVAALRVFAGHDHLMGLARLFDLNGEANLPAWFSSALLLSAAAVLGCLARSAEGAHRRRWSVLAIAFVLLSLDEMASLHELTNAPLRQLLQVGPAFYFPWLGLGVLVAAGLLLFEWPLLRELAPATRTLVLASGVLYVSGAAGFELLAAPLYAAGARESAAHALLVTFEETLEMAGIALFIVALLRHARESRVQLTIHFDDRRLPEEPRLVRLAPRECTRALAWGIFLLASVSLSLQLLLFDHGLVELERAARVMNVSREGNVPTWYQASALLACGALAAVAARAEFARLGSFRWRWLAASALLVYLAMDEAGAIHELSVAPLRAAFNASGLLYYPWIIIGAAAVVIIGLAGRGFLTSLPLPTKRGLLLAAAVFLTGALGVEALGGRHAELFGRANGGYAILTTIEETLEMTGVLLCIRVLMEYVRDAVGPVVVGAMHETAAAPAPTRAHEAEPALLV